jgi:hypothetical protein
MERGTVTRAPFSGFRLDSCADEQSRPADGAAVSSVPPFFEK